MKLRQLNIHNIASIEDAVIHFDKEPLSNSEVFLITGITGSGKSTILDAICLCLYADTPRLDNTSMEGETTAFFLYNRLKKYDVKITAIARGVAFGDDLEYTDELTLAKSIENRQPFKI